MKLIPKYQFGDSIYNNDIHNKYNYHTANHGHFYDSVDDDDISLSLNPNSWKYLFKNTNDINKLIAKAADDELTGYEQSSKNFANKYIGSPGYIQRASKYPMIYPNDINNAKHNISSVSTQYANGIDNAFYIPNSNTIVVGNRINRTSRLDKFSRNNSKIGASGNTYATHGDPAYIYTHELGHVLDNYLAPMHGVNVSTLLNLNSKYPKIIIDPNHDKDSSETYADLFAFRKWLYDNKIYDSTKANTPFTLNNLLRARRLYGNDKVSAPGRFLHSFSNNNIIRIMNEVAQNNYNNSNNIEFNG
jgi:hypothetical protein